MSKHVHISEADREEISRLYDRGMSAPDIARKLKVSYQIVYNRTILPGRTNPKTHRPYGSYAKYLESRARVRAEPDTPEPKNNYFHLTPERRSQIREEWGNLIMQSLRERGKNQTWLAKQIGVSRQQVSYYVHGRDFPLYHYDKLVDTLEIRGIAPSLEKLCERDTVPLD